MADISEGILGTRLAAATAKASDSALRLIDRGFGSYVFGTHEFIFRIPRPRETARRFAVEAKVLPTLGRYVSVAVPEIVEVIAPREGLQYGVQVQRLIEGSTPSEAARRSAAYAESMVQFMVELHAVPPNAIAPLASVGAPDARAARNEILLRATDLLEPVLSEPERTHLREWMSDALHDAGWDYPMATVRHGDLWWGNTLVDESGALAAVVDWETVALGDRSRDVAVQRYLPDDMSSFIEREYAEAVPTDSTLRHRNDRWWEFREFTGIVGASNMDDHHEFLESVEKLRAGPVFNRRPHEARPS